MVETYPFNAPVVASTLYHQLQEDIQGPFRHGVPESGCLTLRYHPGSPRALFSLKLVGDEVKLESDFGEVRLATDELPDPDPLWKSAAEICSHMQEDHRDTFPLFLRQPSVPAEEISMPWIEQSGFILTRGEAHHWVSFPGPCPEPNLVRVQLIKMLKELRRG